MFFISLPPSVKVGDTVDCKINGESRKVTYRDAKHLVIEPDDVRAIVAMEASGDLNNFICGDPGSGGTDVEIFTAVPKGGN